MHSCQSVYLRQRAVQEFTGVDVQDISVPCRIGFHAEEILAVPRERRRIPPRFQCGLRYYHSKEA